MVMPSVAAMETNISQFTKPGGLSS